MLNKVNICLDFLKGRKRTLSDTEIEFLKMPKNYIKREQKYFCETYIKKCILDIDPNLNKKITSLSGFVLANFYEKTCCKHEEEKRTFNELKRINEQNIKIRDLIVRNISNFNVHRQINSIHHETFDLNMCDTICILENNLKDFECIIPIETWKQLFEKDINTHQKHVSLKTPNRTFYLNIKDYHNDGDGIVYISQNQINLIANWNGKNAINMAMQMNTVYLPIINTIVLKLLYSKTSTFSSTFSSTLDEDGDEDVDEKKDNITETQVLDGLSDCLSSKKVVQKGEILDIYTHEYIIVDIITGEGKNVAVGKISECKSELVVKLQFESKSDYIMQFMHYIKHQVADDQLFIKVANNIL